MFRRLLLVPALLTCCAGTGESPTHAPPQEVGGPEKVLAFAGGHVILPCAFSVSASGDFPTVEWSKEDLKPNVIFLYRDHCETHEMKNPAFEFRTSFVTRRLKHGDISLRVSGVKLSDTGRYRCMRLWKNGSQDVTAVELFVGAVSEPRLSMESPEGGGVTLHCEAGCWLPEPHITFLDHQGVEIPAEEPPKRDRDASGCYTVRQRVPLPTATNRVVCRVHQQQLNRSMDSAILVPAACTRSCPLTTCMAAGGAIVFLLLCAVGALSFKICNLLEVQKRAGKETERAETRREVAQLTREVADLKLNLDERDETIRRLQGDLSPQLSPVVCQHNQPTIPRSPSSISTPAASNNSHSFSSLTLSQKQGQKTKHALRRQLSNPGPVRQVPKYTRHHSSPDLHSLSPGSSSVRTSETKPNPNPTKLQRRNSLSLPLSSQSYNRYSPLAGLTEESEPLVS